MSEKTKEIDPAADPKTAVREIKKHLNDMYHKFEEETKPLNEIVAAYEASERTKVLAPFVGKYFRRKDHKGFKGFVEMIFKAEAPSKYHDLRLEGPMFYLQKDDRDVLGPECTLWGKTSMYTTDDLARNFEEISLETFWGAFNHMAALVATLGDAAKVRKTGIKSTGETQ